MLTAIVRIALAAALAGAAVAKLAAPRRSRDALATFSVADPRARTLVLAALIIAELALAVGIALGSAMASWLAAGLMLMFAATLAGAVLRGRAGAPCACFGPASVVGWPGVAIDVGLATAFAVLPLLP